MNLPKQSESSVKVMQCNGMQSHYLMMHKESKWSASLWGSVHTSHIGYPKPFWQRSLSSSSLWTIGQVLYSLRLPHIPMQMGGRHTHGIWIVQNRTIHLLTSLVRYETEGLRFFASKKEHNKGPNNIVDLWRDYNIGECYSFISAIHNMPPSPEKTEEADSHKTLV